MPRPSLRVVLFVALTLGALGSLTYRGPTEIVRWRDVQRRTADTELRQAAKSLVMARTGGDSVS